MKGFTLLELIATLLILAIVFTWAASKIINFDSGASEIKRGYIQNAQDRKAIYERYLNDDEETN